PRLRSCSVPRSTLHGFARGAEVLLGAHKKQLSATAKPSPELRDENGGAEGARTPDPYTASVMLSQLSYCPTCCQTRTFQRAPLYQGTHVTSRCGEVMAGVCGNRTHRRQGQLPPTGFEAQGIHQDPATPTGSLRGAPLTPPLS